MKVCVIGLAGESLFFTVDHFHQKEETVTCSSLHREPGGKGYNQALALGAMGVETVFIGSIGNDDFGQGCMKVLEENNVKGYWMVTEETTALATILTDRFGANQVTVYPGASTMLDESFVDGLLHEIISSQFVVLQLELSERITEHIINICHQYSVKIVMNPAPLKPFVLEHLDLFALITPNQAEYLALKPFLKDNHLVVVTNGKDGASMLQDGREVKFMAEIVNAVDTTGAGDIFTASLVGHLVNGYPIADAIPRAVKVATESVKAKYVIESIKKIQKIQIKN